MRERFRILMVDDVEADAAHALLELKRANLLVDVRRVDREEDFRRELRRFLPQVILSDFSMPQFDGETILAIAREIVPEVPFIILSGTLGEKRAIRALGNGAFDYVPKTNLSRLPPAIEKAIQTAGTRAEQKRAQQLRVPEHSVTRNPAEADSATGALQDAPPPRVPEAWRGRSKRVMYIDDDEALVFLAERVLGQSGCAVTGYTSPALGLREFQSRPWDFDVVVSDLSMPGMSGFDLARKLFTIRPDVPIIMTSGSVSPEDREAARRLGIRELIVKSSMVEELGRALDRLFRST